MSESSIQTNRVTGPRHLLVVGLARNCAAHLQAVIATLQRSFVSCEQVSWLVVESDSGDNTVQTLRTIAAEMPMFRFVSLGALRESLPLRTARIAHCRNVYLKELRNNPEFSDVDHVAVADLDEANRLLNAEAFLSCWNRADWEVCTANQRGPYYDIWALRHDIWSPNDCHQSMAFLRAHGVSEKRAIASAIQSRMITLDENSDWLAVKSAFGGFAVYRRAVLERVQYIGLTDAHEEVCEHVTLHEQIIARGGRIFVNPRLINDADTPHSRYWKNYSTLSGLSLRGFFYAKRRAGELIRNKVAASTQR